MYKTLIICFFVTTTLGCRKNKNAEWIDAGTALLFALGCGKPFMFALFRELSFRLFKGLKSVGYVATKLGGNSGELVQLTYDGTSIFNQIFKICS